MFVDEREEAERLGENTPCSLRRSGLCSLPVDKHDSVLVFVCVSACCSHSLTHTITLFIQLTDNEAADLNLFTLGIYFAHRGREAEIRVFLSVWLPNVVHV